MRETALLGIPDYGYPLFLLGRGGEIYLAIKNYLYLFYGNYLEKEDVDPYAIIDTAKQEIKSAGMRKIKDLRGRLNTQRSDFESELQELYGLTPQDFQIKLENNFAMKLLTTFEEAQQQLEEGLSKAETDIDLGEEIAKAISALDQILKLGANLGGLTVGSIEKAESYYDKILELKEAINSGTAGIKGEKGSVATAGINALNSVSGSLLEIAVAIGWMTIMMKLGKANSSLMGAVGQNKGQNLTITTRPSEELEMLYRQIEQTLANASTEGKADNFVVTQNTVSGTMSWATFQTKNYRNIKDITIESVKTYAELQMGRYFGWHFLINTAGGLGDNHLQENVSFTRLKDADSQITAADIDTHWMNIQQQAKVLAAADIIAAQGAKELGAGLDYYIIRERFSNNLRIIPVADLLDNLYHAYQNSSDGNLNSFGVRDTSWTSGRSLQGSRMKNYGTINASAFKAPPWRPSIPSGWIRSKRAYNPIYEKLKETKVSISLNVGYYF